MNKKHSIDIMGIVLGVIIGCLLGYFLSEKINTSEKIVETSDVIKNEETGYVYLLQLAKFDNPTGASNYIDKLTENGFYAIYVFEDYYYIYGAVGDSIDDLSAIKNEYEIQGYTTIIKKEYVLDLPNKVIENSFQYEFWSEGISNYMKTFKSENIQISEKYYSNYVNLELITNLTMMEKLTASKDKMRLQLQTYKIFVEKLK